ncbi:Rpn family recombination-promoting nuclease/putative transposase [Nostoc sp. FACHB-152]|uniref:Rpn family recombination-promoting nuclease/putative transposase n=1 Tax=unclassified Nostoc TaxID=2593658 RepID=UPI00168515BB|nr:MULTISPECIES: Rpn family recombination-promoting nuclease/putative transposase [unclassified Nostoc]MBD2450570.1 Rpn family recombination-promoting nuclease/putative transposase [Nostoc sp. FACHB-152]MBD2471205.1 Rpn family recombination-promoting nuclease/putative transposase [Nostoc sp. FACHB-145]
MKRDSIYYQIFKRFPALIFELVDNRPAQAQNYRFESVEVKETAFRIDGVFLPPENATPKVIFFAEVQFQKDEGLYHRFFTESLMYLNRNQSQYDDWHCVVIFPSRSLEPNDQRTHRIFLNSDQVQRIYLDELGTSDTLPIGINLMQLTIASSETMAEQAKQLIQRVKLEETGTLPKNEIIEIITTIAVYKFSSLSREEVEAMLGITLEETRVYQEAKEEGLEQGLEQGRGEILKVAVPLLLKSGMSVEQIAQQFNVAVETVEKYR